MKVGALCHAGSPSVSTCLTYAHLILEQLDKTMGSYIDRLDVHDRYGTNTIFFLNDVRIHIYICLSFSCIFHSIFALPLILQRHKLPYLLAKFD